MAITQGQGNPDWSEEETILALDLYLSSGRNAISKHDPRVLQLSELLQRIPWPEGTTKNDKFRNNEGVSMKVYNLRSVDLGRGLRNTIMDRAVWAKYGNKPEVAARLAAEIRVEIRDHGLQLAAEIQLGDDDTPYPEGRILTAMHKRRERNPQLRAKMLGSRKKQGLLYCEMCEWGRSFEFPEYLTAALETHHVVPLSAHEAQETRLADLALLCSNCHRLIHRAIAVQKRWVGIAECAALLRLVP